MLAGAGIGVGAGAPAAASLIREIADALVLGSRWSREVTSRVQPNGPLRFESAMDWLTETADPELSVLSFLDDLTPGPLHNALASMAVSGVRLLTTNFDDLLERAIDSRREAVRTVDLHANTRVRVTAGTIDVVKLHGTRRVHSRGRVAVSPRPLHATISEIVASGGGFGFPAEVHRALKRAVDRRTLLVLGYSGSDDLDVMPALRDCAPARVVWFAFTPDAPKVATGFGAVNAATAELLTAWQVRGIQVDVLVGDTARALRALGWTVPRALHPAALERRAAQRREHLRRWAVTAHLDDPTGLGWVSLILGELGLRRKAYRAAVASRASTRPDRCWSANRRLYELAQNEYLGPYSDLDALLRRALEAAEAARADNDFRAAAQTEILRARTCLRRDDFDGARAALAQAARDLRRERRGANRAANQEVTYALWRGHMFLREGATTRAFRSAALAADLAQAVGDWPQQCEALRVVAQARFVGGDDEGALPWLEQAITMARRGPYIDQLHTSLTIRAIILAELGDPEAALVAAREAVPLGVDAEMFDELPEALRMLGVCASELGLLDEAARAFRLGLRYAITATGAFVADIVVGLAEVLTLTGRRAAARRVIADHNHVADGRPWHKAEMAAVRWRLGDTTNAAANAALARALRTREPHAHEAVTIVRLGRTGTSYDRLVMLVLETLKEPEHTARRERFRAWGTSSNARAEKMARP